MNTREQYSIGLIALGLLLAMLPLTSNSSLTLRPSKLLSDICDQKNSFTVDQVAKFIVSEDSTIQIIDLRTPEEFRMCNIPGSANIPYSDFIKNNHFSFLNNGKDITIYYSNEDYYSNYALTLSRGMHYNNCFAMKGGLNEWFSTVMNSSFSGKRITARENALFETRTRAKKMFTEINSLPDSLKIKYTEAKHLAAKKLDGGCE